jgi:hypothetical protein
VPRRFGYDPCPHRGDYLSCMPNFPAGGFYTYSEHIHLDDSCFLHCDSCPTGSKTELQKIMKTSSGCMVK